MRAIYAALAVSLVLFRTSAAVAEWAFVEGYVYNKLTRVPVAGSVVTMTDFGSMSRYRQRTSDGPRPRDDHRRQWVLQLRNRPRSVGAEQCETE